MTKKILFLNPYFLFFYAALNFFTWYFLSFLLDNPFGKFFSIFAIALLFFIPVVTTKYKNYFLALIGYLWMGFVIFFLSIMIGLTIINMLFSVISLKPLILISISSAVFVTILSFFNKDKIRINNIEIKSAKLKKEAFTLVQLSDVHWGLFIREKELEKICRLVNKLEPDVILFTGDIIDSHGELNDNLISHLKQIQAKTTKIMVLGNHEMFFNKNELYDFFKRADIVLLNNKMINLDKSLNIAGIEYDIKDLNFLSKQIDDNQYNILISHKPITEKDIIKSFDLQIAGHTHAGQFFPITILTKLMFNFNYGVYKLSRGQIVYVSSGTGTWLPPLRCFTRPEVVVFKLSF